MSVDGKKEVQDQQPGLLPHDWGGEMEAGKENEKKQLMREEKNQEYCVLGAKGQEFP